MNEAEATQAVLMLLRNAGVPHLVIGSLASNAYGVVRATQDSDILVAATSEQLNRVRQSLPPELEWESQLQFETITGNTYHIIRLRGTTFQIELFKAETGGFDAEQFHRGKDVDTPSGVQRMVSPEDVVIQKLRWYAIAGRPKDLEDARAVLAVQRGQLDHSYIERWCRQHGSLRILRELIDEIDQDVCQGR